MADSKRKIVKDGWGSRANFQASYGLRMTPEDLAEGDAILDAMQRADERALGGSGVGRAGSDDGREPESDWVRGNRERYEATGRSALKEAAAAQWAEEYKFTQTGDPEMDMIIAMGLRDMKDDSELSHLYDPAEGTLSNPGGSAGEVGVAKSKRQLKRERQRERASKHDAYKEAASAWVKRNRERYEAGGRSEFKEAVAEQLAEEYKFRPTGDPEMDLMIAIGLRGMKGDAEFSHMFESEESSSSSSNLGGPAAGVGATKSKRQRKREKERERAGKHSQETDPPVYSLPQPLTPFSSSAKDREEESRHLTELLRLNRIEPSAAQAPAPTFFVNKHCVGCQQLKCMCGKKDYERRWVIDYRALNSMTVHEEYPSPSVSDLLSRAAGKKEYVKLDLNPNSYLIRVREQDAYKTAFITSRGVFQWNVMPFGLRNAPATIQRMIDSVMAPVRDCCMTFMQDCIIWPTSVTPSGSAENNAYESLVSNTKRVLECMRSADLRALPRTCRWHVPEVNMLGHLVSQEGVSTDPAKLQGIKDYAVPLTLTDVRTFLGLTSYYRDFAAGYAGLAVSLTDLTKKDAPKWIPDLPAPALASFNAIKQLLTEKVTLAVYDSAKPTQLLTDASTEAYGGTIEQDGKPLAFFSDIFDTTQRVWPATDRELHACLAAHERFPHLLQGHGVTWFTNYQTWESLQTTLADSERRKRWREKLRKFPFRVQYKKGKEVDGLTRDSSNDKSIATPGPVLWPHRFSDFEQAVPDNADRRHMR